MLGNFVNSYDFRWCLRKLRDGRLLRTLGGRLGLGSRARVESAWSHSDAPPTNCWDIPAVRERWNRLRSGSPHVTWPEHVARNYLADDRARRAVSLGCGHGAREVAWARLGVFDELVGWDLSPARIERANQRAEEEGVADVLRFEVGDVSKPLAAGERYDVIICEQSLHHFSPLDRILDQIEVALVNDGLFVVDEFVGATRYQWPERQIDAVNQLLGLFPPRFRVEWDGVRTKESHFRPSKLRMILLDPSEAVESSRILPALGEKFDVAERRDYGGGLLQFALSGIAHHFLGADEDARRLLQECFDLEDALLESGEVGSDYSAVVCRKRQRG